MTDDDATMLKRQPAGDLFWGMSHRKAFPHAVAQVRLARQLEAAIPPPSALRQLMRPDRFVASRPDFGGLRIALHVGSIEAIFRLFRGSIRVCHLTPRFRAGVLTCSAPPSALATSSIRRA